MANQAPTTLPFTKAVVECMRKLCPEHLADRSWDNTGLLLESPANHQRPKKDIALLTIDITKAVAQEAVDKDASIIISYHPFIFKGLKSITLANTQQQSLLQLVQEGISVYSPHTALDSVRGGLNDWLADVVAKCSKLHGGFFIEANDYKRKAIIPNEEMTG
ncbi:MAG: hypothetical protein M1829_006842 [Trizodia sp. TS-e1964]|nr:MAG: hypothetical protein M1829_006842 [Trizodia sp. TS-e1964]